MDEYHLDAWCSCGFKGYTQGSEKDGYGICPKCGKKIFSLTCTKCETTFNVFEKNVTLLRNTWKCEYCKIKNIIKPEVLSNVLKIYTKDNIPLDKLTSSARFRGINIKFILISLIIIYIIFKLLNL